MMDERFIGNDSVFVVSLALPLRIGALRRMTQERPDRSIEFIAMLLALSASASVYRRDGPFFVSLFVNAGNTRSSVTN